MINIFYYLLAFLIMQRLAELMIANRNTTKLLADGAVEHGRGHYPLFILLHGGWIVALTVSVTPDTPFNIYLFVVFVFLQMGRIWVVATLGRFWTTRIISLPDAPLVRNGPFRFVRHPNYLVVVGEIAIVPLIAGMWEIALVFSVLNFALLWWRIRIEEQAIAPRRRA